MLGHARAFPPRAACGGTTRRERRSENGVGSAVNSCRWINIRYYVSCLLPAKGTRRERERERGGRGETQYARSGACLSGVRTNKNLSNKIFTDGDNAKVGGRKFRWKDLFFAQKNFENYRYPKS